MADSRCGAAGGADDQELTDELALAGGTRDPVSEAIRAGQHDVVKHLRQKPEYHHLRLSVELGKEVIVSLLLELGADADPKHDWEDGVIQFFTPLHLAAKAGQAGIVSLLLDAGADADRRVNTDVCQNPDYCEIRQTESALHLAAAGGHVDVIKVISQREPSILNSVADYSGFTALHYAAVKTQVGSINALVEAGADLDAEGGRDTGTALHIAAESRGREPALRALLSHGAKVDLIGWYDKRTPLGLAVKNGNVRAIEILASAGADVREPLLLASCSRYWDAMVPALLRGGADVNMKRESDGNTPLHLAAERNLISKVDVLLRAGADETAVNARGETPLDVAGRRPDTIYVALDSSAEEDGDDVRALLVNAPRDRADRAWSRRGFFVLCRAFPERVRLQLTSSQHDRVNDPDSAPSSASDDPLPSSASNKRAATAGAEGKAAGAHAEESITSFRTAMDRMMRLEADVVFQTIMEYV